MARASGVRADELHLAVRARPPVVAPALGAVRVVARAVAAAAPNLRAVGTGETCTTETGAVDAFAVPGARIRAEAAARFPKVPLLALAVAEVALAVAVAILGTTPLSLGTHSGGR